jgi:sigma-E factor negative regulatory protein RseC
MEVDLMERLGKITKIENNLAQITLQRHSACAECGGCGVGRGDKRKIVVEAINKVDAQVGDLVMVEVADENFLTAVFIAYAVPVIGLFLGYILGVKLSSLLGRAAQGQIFGIIGGFSLLALSFFGLKLLNPRFASSRRFTPTISRIVE